MWDWVVNQLLHYRPHRWAHLQGVPEDRGAGWIENDQLDGVLHNRRIWNHID